MNIELITLITLAATLLTMVVGLVAIIKFLFNLKDEINNLKIEVVKLQHRFDVSEGKQSDLEKQISEDKADTNSRISQVEAEQKSNYKEFVQAIPHPSH